MKEEKYLKTLRFNTKAIILLIALFIACFLAEIGVDIAVLTKSSLNTDVLGLTLRIIFGVYYYLLIPVFSISFIYHIKKGNYEAYPLFFKIYVVLGILTAVSAIYLTIIDLVV